MAQDQLIRAATFNPRVKTYWILSGVILCVITIIGIPFLLLWVPLGLYFSGRYLDRMSCELTSKALKMKKGMFVRVEKTIPLEKITDMGMVQGPIMRWLDIERLTVETAGQSGAGALLQIVGIEHAKDFREAVLAQRDVLAQSASSQRMERSETSEQSTDTQQAIHDTLLRIEALLARQEKHEPRV